MPVFLYEYLILPFSVGPWNARFSVKLLLQEVMERQAQFLAMTVILGLPLGKDRLKTLALLSGKNVGRET